MRKVRITALLVSAVIMISLLPKVLFASNNSEEKPYSGIKNIIFMIGDGMGINSAYAADIFNREAGLPEVNFLDFPFKTFITTHAANSLVTDSAASGTALATGSKTLVCRKLAEEGILRFPAKGTHWRVGHLNAVLRNRVYIGEIRAGDKSYPGVHEAILDRGLWEKVQAKLSDRTVSHRRGLRISEKAPLSGLVKCGTCGSPMTYNWTSKKHNRVLYGYYTDLADSKRPFPTCPVRRVSADRLEKVVDGIILKFLRLPMIERTIAGELGWMMHEVDRMLGVQDLLWRNLLPDEKRELIRLLIGGVTIFPNAAEVKMRTSGCKPLIEEMKNDFTHE